MPGPSPSPRPSNYSSMSNEEITAASFDELKGTVYVSPALVQSLGYETFGNAGTITNYLSQNNLEVAIKDPAFLQTLFLAISEFNTSAKPNDVCKLPEELSDKNFIRSLDFSTPEMKAIAEVYLTKVLFVNNKYNVFEILQPSSGLDFFKAGKLALELVPDATRAVREKLNEIQTKINQSPSPVKAAMIAYIFSTKILPNLKIPGFSPISKTFAKTVGTYFKAQLMLIAGDAVMPTFFNTTLSDFIINNAGIVSKKSKELAKAFGAKLPKEQVVPFVSTFLPQDRYKGNVDPGFANKKFSDIYDNGMPTFDRFSNSPYFSDSNNYSNAKKALEHVISILKQKSKYKTDLKKAIEDHKHLPWPTAIVAIMSYSEFKVSKSEAMLFTNEKPSYPTETLDPTYLDTTILIKKIGTSTTLPDFTLKDIITNSKPRIKDKNTTIPLDQADINRTLHMNLDDFPSDADDLNPNYGSLFQLAAKKGTPIEDALGTEFYCMKSPSNPNTEADSSNYIMTESDALVQKLISAGHSEAFVRQNLKLVFAGQNSSNETYIGFTFTPLKSKAYTLKTDGSELFSSVQVSSFDNGRAAGNNSPLLSLQVLYSNNIADGDLLASIIKKQASGGTKSTQNQKDEKIKKALKKSVKKLDKTKVNIMDKVFNFVIDKYAPNISQLNIDIKTAETSAKTKVANDLKNQLSALVAQRNRQLVLAYSQASARKLRDLTESGVDSLIESSNSVATTGFLDTIYSVPSFFKDIFADEPAGVFVNNQLTEELNTIISEIEISKSLSPEHKKAYRQSMMYVKHMHALALDEYFYRKNSKNAKIFTKLKVFNNKKALSTKGDVVANVLNCFKTYAKQHAKLFFK